MKIYVKKIEGITLPTKKTPVSAGYDVKSTSGPKFVGEQHSDGLWKRIDYVEYETNLYLAPEILTCHLNLKPRSSVSKYNLVLANSIGTLDNDYRGMVICRFKYIWQPEDFVVETIDFSVQGTDGNIQHVKMPTGRLHCKINTDKIYKIGDDIAQLEGVMTVGLEFELVDELNQTKRGEGGFGSTDQSKIQPKHEIPRLIQGKSLKDMYNEAGGVPTKLPYTEEIKKRQRE